MPDDAVTKSDAETVKKALEAFQSFIKKENSTLNANMSLLITEVDQIHQRLGNLEVRTSDMETWRKNNSQRVRGLESSTSSIDMAHESKLSAQLISHQNLEKKVQEIDAKQNAQLELLTDIRQVVRNPYVKQIITILATAFVTWLSLKLGVRIPGIN